MPFIVGPKNHPVFTYDWVTICITLLSSLIADECTSIYSYDSSSFIRFYFFSLFLHFSLDTFLSNIVKYDERLNTDGIFFYFCIFFFFLQLVEFFFVLFIYLLFWFERLTCFSFLPRYWQSDNQLIFFSVLKHVHNLRHITMPMLLSFRIDIRRVIFWQIRKTIKN